MSHIFTSRKFWAALIGLIAIVVQAFFPDFPLDSENLANMVYLIMAYIFGVALEDGLTARAMIKN